VIKSNGMWHLIMDYYMFIAAAILLVPSVSVIMMVRKYILQTDGLTMQYWLC
jgi:hypothetical protein